MTHETEKLWNILLTVAFGYLFEVRFCFTMNFSCPSACFCDGPDTFVSCEGDGQWDIPNDLPRTTARLDIRNFVVTTLTEMSLIELTDVHEIKIQQCRLAAIEGGVFTHMLKLMHLDLGQNQLANLSSDVFEGLHNLHYLDLSFNWLTNISNAFRALNNVEQLNLRSNRIKGLDNRCFKGLVNLQYLNLDLNEIVAIEADAFEYNKKLVHLTLSNNPIKSLHRLDFFSERLQFIDVSNSGLDRIPQSLTRFVRDLRVGKNNITRISAGDFDSYPYLGFLVLDNNRITDIEADALGRQDYLLRLWLNGNELTSVPADLPPSLKTLHVEENKLEMVIPYSFKGLVGLEHLFLQRNQIANLSVCAFCDLTNLRSLDLQANRIEQLYKGIFANLTNLETLDLSQNKLMRMEASCFDGLLTLRTLHVSRIYTAVVLDKGVFKNLTELRSIEMYDSQDLVNKIFSSTRVLQSLQSVHDINIMYNQLVRLRPDLASFFPHLEIIKLGDNNWDCSSDILWMSNWLKSYPTLFFRSHTIQCATPEKLHSLPIMLISENDFAGDNETIGNLTSPSENPENVSTKPTVESITLTSKAENSETLHTEVGLTETDILISTENKSSVRTEARQIQHYTNRTIQTTTPLTNSTLSATDSPLNQALIPVIKHPPKAKEPKKGEEIAEKASNFQMLVASMPDSNTPHWDSLTTITIITSLAGGCLILLASSVILFAICRFRVQFPRKRRGISTRRSKSITYFPQQDEVAILTVSENTVG